MSKDILPEEYLQKDFEYGRLTKNQLRKIMYENGVESIPPLTAKKSELVDAYRINIHNRIDVLGRKSRVSMDNPFQKTPTKRMDIAFEKVPSTPTAKVHIAASKPKHASASKAEESGMREASSKRETRDASVNSYVTDSLSDHSNGSFNSSSFITSSFLNSSSDRQSPRKGDDRQRELRKRAFTSDPALDKASPSEAVSGPRKTPRSKAERRLKTKRSRRWYLLLIPLAAAALYLRFFCPYCRDDEFLCVFPPKHSRVVEGELVCDEGFVARKGLFKTYCEWDNRQERMVERETKQIRRLLEKRSGDFSYGMVPVRAASLKMLTRNPEVVEMLKKEGGIVVSGDSVYSVNRRVTAGTFARYYTRRILMGMIPLAILLVVVRMYQSFARKRKERMRTARKIVKDVVDVLVRQIYVSAKNTNFPSHVNVEQLQDCFGVDKGVWRDVEGIVLKNSNIRELQVANKKAWEWVGPILYKPEFNGSLF